MCIFSNCAFSVKITLNYFYVDFKQWLQEVKSLYMYFSLIRLIPNLYDMYIMYPQWDFILKYFYFIFMFFTIQNSKN
jgi:hypothetical protein